MYYSKANNVVGSGRLSDIGFRFLVIGLIVYIGVNLVYEPMVWKAHFVEDGGDFTIGLLEQEQLARSASKSGLYAYRISYICMVLASFFAVLDRRLRKRFPLMLVVVYFLMIIWNALLFLFHPPDSPLFETNTLIYNRLSPGVLALFPLALYSYYSVTWRRVRRLLLFVCWVAVGAALYGILQVAPGSRIEAYRWVHFPGLVLEMTALLALGGQRDVWGVMRYMAYVPIFVLLVVDIYLQARSGFVLLFVMFLVFVWSQKEGDGRVSYGLIRIRYLLTGLFLVYVVYLVFEFMSPGMGVKESYEAFKERLDVDSRSWQWVAFVSALRENPDVWLWGRGHLDFDGFGGAGVDGIDSGYANILWVGGAPLLLLYLLITVYPLIKAFLGNNDKEDVYVLSLCAVFFVRMFSSTIAGFEVQFILFILLMGRVMSLSRKRGRRLSRGRLGYRRHSSSV